MSDVKVAVCVEGDGIRARASWSALMVRLGVVLFGANTLTDPLSAFATNRLPESSKASAMGPFISKS